ncbi:hypothetical protein HIM_12073 [Hirsutella minnesotensis 3608]|uniref:Uncharacterized protein n=1 Tax=Hirsutella minnesotensis 3608 TaxID=1043627 RepID=A0A0F8A0G8_9HYPO|nr:hypothetical protein HIM_12073 [Hirsutella minnesotensis 3608]
MAWEDKRPKIECIPSSQRMEVHLWQPGAVHRVRELGRQCRGQPVESLFLEMKNRRGSLLTVFGRGELGRSVRESWCALTVRFRDADSLLQRVRELPRAMKGGLFCWAWTAAESGGMWRGCPAASTCVLLLGGIPASYSVRRVAQLILQEPSLTRFSDGHDFASDWWIQPLADEMDFDYWFSCHENVLRRTHGMVELHPGDSVDVIDMGLQESGRGVGIYPSPGLSSSDDPLDE